MQQQKSNEKTTRPGNAKSFGHALRVLDSAAKDSGKEVRSMIDKDYRQIRSAFREVRDASKDSLMHAKDTVINGGRHAVQAVDRSAHENPWTYIGATAAVASLAGFLAGRKTKS